MKKCGFVLLFALVVARAFAAEDEFVPNLSPGEAQAAGLGKLSPAELAKLEQLVQRFKSGVVVEVQKTAEAKVRAVEHAAEQKVAAAEARVAETVKEKPAPTGVAPRPGWFTALLTLHKAAEKPADAEPLRTRLIGRFTGWTGHTVFKLEDGTRWTQQNAKDRYEYYPALESPKVTIVPAAIAGFWLRIEGVNMSVRIVPTELPDPK